MVMYFLHTSRKHHPWPGTEEPMITLDFITALFYEIDEQMGAIPKHPEAGDVSQVLIPSQRDCPNSYRLMKSPITRSCMRSVLEKHSVRRTSRLIRVRRLRCLLSIFCVFSLPT